MNFRLCHIGNSAYKAEGLPDEVIAKIDVTIDLRMAIIVGEARGNLLHHY